MPNKLPNLEPDDDTLLVEAALADGYDPDVVRKIRQAEAEPLREFGSVEDVCKLLRI